MYINSKNGTYYNRLQNRQHNKKKEVKIIFKLKEFKNLITKTG